MTEVTKLPDASLPEHIQFTTVDSSHHSRAGYDPDASQLYIDFAKPGAAPNIYRYSGVSADDNAAYVAAESQGKHFLQNIKGKFDYAKVIVPAAQDIG